MKAIVVFVLLIASAYGLSSNIDTWRNTTGFVGPVCSPQINGYSYTLVNGYPSSITLYVQLACANLAPISQPYNMNGYEQLNGQSISLHTGTVQNTLCFLSLYTLDEPTTGDQLEYINFPSGCGTLFNGDDGSLYCGYWNIPCRFNNGSWTWNAPCIIIIICGSCILLMIIIGGSFWLYQRQMISDRRREYQDMRNTMSGRVHLQQRTKDLLTAGYPSNYELMDKSIPIPVETTKSAVTTSGQYHSDLFDTNSKEYEMHVLRN